MAKIPDTITLTYTLPPELEAKLDELIRLLRVATAGTTPEELAVIVAEELERETGEATRDQWEDPDD